jgi:hypothetical protein
MPNNRKGLFWSIRRLVDKRSSNYAFAYEIRANALENSKYGHEFAEIIYPLIL